MHQGIRFVAAHVVVVGWLGAGALSAGALAVACSGAKTTIGGAGDGGDATSDGSTLDAASADDAADGGATPDGATPSCAPPSDPSKAALCLHLSPEAIAFTSDPKFDGKGYVAAQVFDVQHPDLPDGGTAPPLATTLVPAGAPAQTLDLAQGVSTVRFDGLPSTVYVRAFFVDDPATVPSLGPGIWIAGYDLAGGIKKSMALLPQPLALGAGTDVTLDLSALREMTITVNRTATPAGNGEGPATAVAIVDQMPTAGAAGFGVGQNPCARVDGTNAAKIPGFVIGKGPYYVAAVVDDFGAGDGGEGVPPGSLASITIVDGGIAIPAGDRLTYPADAYRVSFTVSLGLTIPPSAGATDRVSCP